MSPSSPRYIFKYIYIYIYYVCIYKKDIKIYLYTHTTRESPNDVTLSARRLYFKWMSVIMSAKERFWTKQQQASQVTLSN